MESQQNSRGGWNRGRGRGEAASSGTARRGGSGVGQTRGWRQQRNGNRTSQEQPPAPPPQPLGPAVDSIDVNVLLVEQDAPEIEDVRYIASYNWVNGKEPVIIVPGSPPAWTPPAQDAKLKSDSEDVFRDINAARYPSYPMEPTIRSVLAMQPDFELEAVDIVACGSTIGNLLRCAGAQPRAFRFDVNVVGDTVFFIRRENSPTEIITDLRGYGHTFPEAYTTWDREVRNSCSHQRVIQYEFGGLQVLIRTETDGYLKPTTRQVASSTGAANDDPSLEDSLGGIAVGTQEPSHAGKLKIKMAGNMVPQGRIFDIKTRASYKPYNMDEILPRLWANQTPNFLIAYHEFGQFDKPAVASVKEDVLKWQKANSSLLARFHALTKRIVDTVKDTHTHRFEVSWDGEGPLCITEQLGEGRSVLPSDLLSLWNSSE
ncbi:hypothetical protein BKA65DRAFT_476916 [Rhexocercosporidium sp. MPI-PUGE-AT-0058]|nr:hypothetical protein BKA65DRAFT_476916 [Rhexocercosporidium sp. MPI-PUGE-AT-0058]